MLSQDTQPFPTRPQAAPTDEDSLPQHNRELTLRRYLVLQEEHESIRQHLDELSVATSPTTAAGTTSLALGPTRAGHKRTDSAIRRASIPQYNAQRPRIHARSGHGRRGPVAIDIPAAGDPTGSLSAEITSEEAKLVGVNEGIKRALTDLLNCETVRPGSDRAFRTWIMSRLMDVERELRSGRRRRSCPVD